MMMKTTQVVANPFRIQPMTPMATKDWKNIFLRPLWSASAPQIGPRIATTIVTTEMAIE